MRLKKATVWGLNTFKDPVTVDFDSLPSGLYVIVGDNGEGKTTFLEAIFPGVFYLEFPSRGKHIKDFASEDGGGVEVEFSLENSTYKATVDIKGSRVAATLFTATADDWTPLTSGKVGEYRAAIDELLGPKSAALASVFSAQSGAGSFDVMKPAERRSLFRQYLGMSRWDDYHAKINGRISDLPVGDLEEHRRNLDDLLAELDNLEKIKSEKATEHQKAKDLKSEIDRKLEMAKTYELRSKKLARLHEVLEEKKLHGDWLSKNSHTEYTPESLSDRDDAVRSLEREWQAEVDKLSKSRSSLREAERNERIAEQALGEYLVEERRSRVLDTVPCGGEGVFAKCQYIVDAYESREWLKENPKSKFDDAVKKAKAEVEELNGIVKELEAVADKAQDAYEDLDEEVRAQRRANEARMRQVKTQSQEIARREHLVSVLKGEAEDLSTALEHIPEVDPPEESSEYLSSQSEQLNASIAKIDAEYSRADGRLEGYTGVADEMRYKVARLEERCNDLRVLEILSQSTSPTGVPIYEIAAAGDDVTGEINNLLSDALDGRFSVRISTTEPKKSGGMKESFDLAVMDRNSLEEREFDILSPGEKTFVGGAMKMGLSLYRANSGDVKYETMFVDEPAGALFAENARRYANMLHRAREAGKFHHILAISHSDKITEAADKLIVIANGTIEVKDPWEED